MCNPFFYCLFKQSLESEYAGYHSKRRIFSRRGRLLEIFCSKDNYINTSSSEVSVQGNVSSVPGKSTSPC